MIQGFLEATIHPLILSELDAMREGPLLDTGPSVSKRCFIVESQRPLGLAGA